MLSFIAATIERSQEVCVENAGVLIKSLDEMSMLFDGLEDKKSEFPPGLCNG